MGNFEFKTPDELEIHNLKFNLNITEKLFQALQDENEALHTKVKNLESRLLMYEQTVTPIKIDDLPDILKQQAE